MKHIQYLILFVCLFYGLRINATDSLDVDFIDKYYVTQPQRAYQLLKPAFERQQQEGWKKTTRERYERVAGYVCLANNYYAKAMRHALNIEDLDKSGKNDEIQLKSFELQCNVLDELGQYEQLTRVLAKIHEIIENLDDDDVHSRTKKAFFQLYCAYYKIRALSNSGDFNGALREMSNARIIVAKYQQDQNEKVRGNCAIMRHCLDELQGNIYIDHGMCEKAVNYIKELISDLDREERRGGDEATDKAGYDIHRIALYLLLGHALADCGQKEESLKAADEAYCLWNIYPPTTGTIGSLLGIYLKVDEMPTQKIISEAETFFKRNRNSPSMELATVCNNLLWLYTRIGKREQIEYMLKEQARINQYINRENMEFYNVMSENSALRISYYRQRVHKMMAAGVAVALIIVIIGMMIYRHQRIRNSEYIYKYVKLAANRVDTKHVTSSKKVERNFVERIREVLSKDKAFLNADINYEQLEQSLMLKRRSINHQLSENYQTSLKEIVTDMRLEYACKLLEETDYVLEFVARESAFGAARTFYRAFKNKYNLTPTEYRKLSLKSKGKDKDE
ncbi:MAG: helix-turn-helix transcriptional regulator [Prevotella sp.]